jgi:two-component sensor histidine kinase
MYDQNEADSRLIKELNTVRQQLVKKQTTIESLQERCIHLEQRVAEQTNELYVLAEKVESKMSKIAILKTSLAQIERAKQEWEVAVDSLPELICVVNEEGDIIRANRTIERWGLGKVVAVSGKRLWEFMPPTWRNFWQMAKPILSQGQPYEGGLEDEILQRHLHVRILPMRPETVLQNRVVTSFAALIICDVTQTERLEQNRQETEETLQRRNRELSILNQATKAFISTLDLGQVLVNVLEEVRRLLGVVAYSIWSIDTQSDELVCWRAVDIHHELLQNWRLPLGQGIVGWVAEHNQSVIVPDTRTDERHFKDIDQITEVEIRSILSVPLQCKTDANNPAVIGVLHLMDTRVNRFSEADLRLIEPLAATIAIAIENARLYEQVKHDAETKAILLSEVNHRVRNNLSVIIGLLYAEQNHIDTMVYHTIMNNLINRIQGLATVHGLLSTSGWQPVRLSDLAQRIIYSVLKTSSPDKLANVVVTPSPVQITANQAHNLALIINELTTNTIKQAELASQEQLQIQVDITGEDDIIGIDFMDANSQVSQFDQSVDFGLIQNIVQKSLRGTMTLHNDDSMVVKIRFKAEPLE